MKKRILKLILASVLVVGLMAFSGTVYADEITDSINEAMTQYKNNNYSAASEALSYALQLLGQKKGGQLEELLPQPLPGWTADDASSQAVNAVVIGGGINAERRYHRDNSSVSIKITTDSPMLQGMMMMLSNPMFATADGGKLERIKGQKAIVKFDSGNQSGSITFVVGNRTLILVEGDSVTPEDLKNYAAAINFEKIAALQ